ncbi:MAG TPA: hypothetical protein VG077_16715 [Verrucomicrobiae bacterium]|nr:hypothetical protein [Verrucomicrobiae bacterium]
MESNLVFVSESDFACAEPALDLPLTSISGVYMDRYFLSRLLVIHTHTGMVHSFRIWGSVAGEDGPAMKAACAFIQSEIKPNQPEKWNQLTRFPPETINPKSIINIKNIIRAATAASIGILASGCASIVDGGPKTVRINSNPAGATVPGRPLAVQPAGTGPVTMEEVCQACIDFSDRLTKYSNQLGSFST